MVFLGVISLPRDLMESPPFGFRSVSVRFPFGFRSVLVRFPLDCRSTFASPSFHLRFLSVVEASGNGRVTELERLTIAGHVAL